MRILSHEIPSAVGQSVTVAGWVHRRRRLAAVSFLILRDRSGLSPDRGQEPETQAQLDELGEETVVQVTGTVAANPQAPGGAEIVDPVIEPLTEPAADTADRAVATHSRRRTARRTGQRADRPAAPGRTGRLGDRRGRAARVPYGAGRSGLHRDPDAEDRRYGDRVRRQRVRAGLLRRPGVPGPVAAVLQADDGRGVRAGLRGRPGVPRRAARHGPAPGRVRVAGRGVRLHPGPSRRSRRTAVDHRGDAVGGRRAGRLRRWSGSGSRCRRSRSTCRCCTSARR